MPAPDVALISPYPPAGDRHGGRSGVASYTAQLAHALSSHGARVAVLAPRDEGEPRAARDGAVTVERPFERGPRALPEAALAALATRAPVVHVQHEVFLYGGASSAAGLVPALAALRARRRLVVTMHHVVDPLSVDRDFVRLHRVRSPAFVARGALGAIQAGIRRLASAVIVHEPALARSVRGAAVIPHGLEAPDGPARAAARAALELDDERFVALCFGFVAPYKGLEVALEAAAVAGDEVSLVVAGAEHPRLAEAGAGYSASLRKQHPHARFTGHVPDREVAAWFAAADLALFLYPRPFATSGALALALAHSTPVLLSEALAACADAPEALAVAPDPGAVADELLALARTPKRLAERGALTAELADGRSWSAVARRHLDVYEEVSHAERPTRRRLRAA